MSFLGTVRSIGEAFGVWKPTSAPLGCSVGQLVFRETKRSALIANFTRPKVTLKPETQARLRTLYPDLDFGSVRIRTGCRLPANRFNTDGSIYAMTIGSTIYWRDAAFDESDPNDLVRLIHELMHVDQVRRLGGESAFACAYGKGYMAGGGKLPTYIKHPTEYHRNPLEAEAYTFEAKFRDERGDVDASSLP